MKTLYASLFLCTILLLSIITKGSKLEPAEEKIIPSSQPTPQVFAKPEKQEIGTQDFAATLKEFTSLSRAERKERIKAAKEEMKAFKEQQKAGSASTNTLLLVILAILLPPLAVYLHQGQINSKFWISLLLTLLFYIPGLIYALIVILGNGG